jgi:hypothetical protein
MRDELKLWMLAFVLLAMLAGGLMFIAREQANAWAKLREAACVQPETVACALAVRQ